MSRRDESDLRVQSGALRRLAQSCQRVIAVGRGIGRIEGIKTALCHFQDWADLLEKFAHSLAVWVREVASERHRRQAASDAADWTGQGACPADLRSEKWAQFLQGNPGRQAHNEQPRSSSAAGDIVE